MDGLEDINKQLLTKELLSNDELQKARKELITGLNEMLSSSRVNIGIKRMGEIYEKAFQNTVRHKFPPEEAEIKTVELCSPWQEKLKNPDFHPFKIIHIDGKHEKCCRRMMNLYISLRMNGGDEIYNAVTTALKELNDYNPSS
ncbi:Factor of DNA methylation 1 [Abeliophyllum distichum]|uniref:Factor of DNA methylation 1 n=1 Tax=Abeliophyllum distichum TaxID=126358 RepID=A0ABD1VB79_9LAMI